MQPGGVVAIDVNLYRDASPNSFGLQTDLSNYLVIDGATFAMADAGPVGRGDEPSAVAVSRDNRHVYLFNGGYSHIEGLGVEGLHLADYTQLVGGAIFHDATALSSGGLAGTMSAINSANNSSSARYSQLERELRRLAMGGIALMVAPGFTGTFDTANGNQQNWLFPSNVLTGWNASFDAPIVQDSDSGLVVSQFTMPEIFSVRPMAVAMKPRGPQGPENRRALVAFGYTGNFGVLDLDAQTAFGNASPPNASIASLPSDMFHAFVGVTPALRIGPHAWPERGVFRSHGSTLSVPSPDEALLNATDLEYAQNGKFAVATHAGKDIPSVGTYNVPDFVNDIFGAREPLLELGFIYNGGDRILAPGIGSVGVGAADRPAPRRRRRQHHQRQCDQRRLRGSSRRDRHRRTGDRSSVFLADPDLQGRRSRAWHRRTTTTMRDRGSDASHDVCP